MPAKRFRCSDEAFIQAVGYFTIIAVALLGFNITPPGLQRLVTLSLLLVFGLLFALAAQGTSSRWRKHAYFAIQTLIVGALIASHTLWGVFPILFFVLSAHAMGVFPERTGFLWVGIFTLVTAVIYISMDELSSALLTLLPFAAGYWFFAAFARAMTSAERARAETQRLLSELQRAHQQLQDYTSRLEELTIAEERNRLAREMHDTLGHRLTVAAVQLEGAQRLITADPQRAEGMIATVRGQVREALAELRHTVATLRQPLQTDLVLPHALQRLASSFEQATGVRVHLTLPPGDLALPDPHRLTLYRAAQEALTNIQKHAQAKQAWMDLRSENGCVSLEVRDDGIGLPEDASSSGFGLRGLHERVAQLNGKVIFEDAPEGGAHLSIILPAPTNATNATNSPSSR